MIPTSLKFYFGIAMAAIGAAVVGGYTSGGDGVGPLSAGYKGGVGDQVSYTILLTVAFVALIVGGLLTWFRDADAEAAASTLGRSDAPVGQNPAAPSVWPILAGIGMGALAVGFAISPVLVGVGVAILAMVAVEWTMTAWADRATADSATNEELRDQLMGPFEVPLLGLLGGGIFVLAMSRIMLATSEIGAVVIGGIVAVLILGAAVLLTQRPKLSKNLVTGVVGIIAIGVLAGGVWGAIEGTREVEHHGDEHEESSTEDHSDESEDAG